MHYSIICCSCLFESHLFAINKNRNLLLICCENYHQEFMKLRNKSVVMEIGLTKKWFHIVEDYVFHACFKYIFTIMRITKFQRHNFGNEFLNTNSIRVRNNNPWDFLPGVNCLQIDNYNFSSMEFSWQLNCVNFFCYDYQKHLCFKVIHQEFNCLNQTVIVKNDFFPCICYGC